MFAACLSRNLNLPGQRPESDPYVIPDSPKDNSQIQSVPYNPREEVLDTQQFSCATPTDVAAAVCLTHTKPGPAQVALHNEQYGIPCATLAKSPHVNMLPPHYLHASTPHPQSTTAQPQAEELSKMATQEGSIRPAEFDVTVEALPTGQSCFVCLVVLT